MSNQISAPQPRTWMPAVAGILCLFFGSVDLILGVLVSFLAELLGTFIGILGLSLLGVPLILLGIISILGGIAALNRRAWTMALIGSIAILIWPSTVFGIVAIVFVVLSRPEFS